MSPLLATLWAAAIALLGLKAAATLILLLRPREARLVDRQGLRLWWATKITPVLAVPCLIAIALLEHDRSGLLTWSVLMVFVTIAVPLMVWRRFGRAR